MKKADQESSIKDRKITDLFIQKRDRKEKGIRVTPDIYLGKKSTNSN